MRPRQTGQALLVLAILLVLGASWAMMSALGSASRNAIADRTDNARVLAEAKAALVGWVAMTALQGSEANPGRLPCPQNWGDVGGTFEGRAGATCSDPAIGWLPWRTLGIQKPLDASGAQVWYVVSPGWHLLPGSPAPTLDINSSTDGQLMLNGSPVVALIIAPGPPLAMTPNSNQTAAGCAARTQSQALNLPSTAPNVSDFLECQNATPAGYVFTSSVVDNATNPVFNDQVVAVTAADVLPVIEAAIAKRIEGQIAPVLKTVYGDPLWGTTSTNPAFALPAQFSDPTNSDYRGQVGATQGLVPFNYHAATCGGDARCSGTSINWSSPTLSSSGGPGYLASTPGCYVSGSTPACEGYYYGGTVNISLSTAAADITRGLRTFTSSDHTASGQWWNWTGSAWAGPFALTPTVSRTLASDGAANFVASATLPNVSTWGYYMIQETRPAIVDHPILSSTAANTGWFVRNEWYRLLYYAIAPSHAPGGSLNCSDSGAITCLQVTNITDPTKQQAILVLAGRALVTLGQTRPSSSLQNYLDTDENRNGDTLFVQQVIGASSNDRFISMSKKP